MNKPFISYPMTDSTDTLEFASGEFYTDTREMPVVGSKVSSVDGPRYATQAGWEAPANYLSERPTTKSAPKSVKTGSFLDDDLLFGLAFGAAFGFLAAVTMTAPLFFYLTA